MCTVNSLYLRVNCPHNLFFTCVFFVSNITITRRSNVIALHRRFLEQAIAAGLPAKGLDQLFAAKLEISASMWSQVKSSRPIGDTLARQIEAHCGQPLGWLDEEHASDAPDPAEERFIALARKTWREASAKEKRALTKWLGDQ